MESGKSAPRARLDRGAALLLTVLCASWGLNQVAVKVANTGISPALQCGLRSLGAAALLLVWVRARGVLLWERDGTLWPGLLAGLLFAVEFLLIYVGLDYTTASRGVLFTYTAPFFVAAGAHVLLRGDRLTPAKTAGLVAAFCGTALAFADGLRLPSGRELVGDAMCLVAAVAWAATTITIKATRLQSASAEKVLMYQLAVSGVLLPPASLLLGEPGVFAPGALVLGALAYQIVIVAFASYVVWFWLVSVYPASRLAAFSFLTPVFAVAFGGLLLDEPIGPALLGALALIAAGIYLVNRN